MEAVYDNGEAIEFRVAISNLIPKIELVSVTYDSGPGGEQSYNSSIKTNRPITITLDGVSVANGAATETAYVIYQYTTSGVQRRLDIQFDGIRRYVELVIDDANAKYVSGSNFRFTPYSKFDTPGDVVLVPVDYDSRPLVWTNASTAFPSTPNNYTVKKHTGTVLLCLRKAIVQAHCAAAGRNASISRLGLLGPLRLQTWDEEPQVRG